MDCVASWQGYCSATPCFAAPSGNWIHFSRTRRRTPCTPLRPRMAVAPDVVVIGGGAIGLSTAFELAKAGRSVRVISRDVSESASKAGAGMLAPMSECLHDNASSLQHLLSLSRNMYPKFVSDLQALSGKNVQYVSQQDFLQPLLHDEPAREVPGGTFIDSDMLKNVEPALGPAVRGAIRVPTDAHVSNRMLVDALETACRHLNVEISEGTVVQKLQVSTDSSNVEGIVLKSGDIIKAPHYVAACGAWSSRLLKGIPVRPVKGQMICLKPISTMSNSTPGLQHVLYGRDVYIVPKDNCSMYYVGATVEEAGYCRSPTAGGILHLLKAATTLVPSFRDYYVSETWAGLRPATPDNSPIIGNSDFRNLTIATGTYRNGILLAPAVSKLTAACVLNNIENLSTDLQSLLPEFSLSRFLDPSSSGKKTQLHFKPELVTSIETNVHLQEDLIPGVEPETHNIEGADVDATRTADAMQMNESTRSCGAEKQVMLWRILPDGSHEPVEPSKRFANAKQTASTKTTASNGVHTGIKKRLDLRDIGNSVTEVMPPAVMPITTDIGTSNDAYDDVMRHRADAENTLREGMAKSRCFGRSESSLQDEGEVLSISAEEEARFDAAFNAAKEEIATWGTYSIPQHGEIDPDDPALLQSEFPPLASRQEIAH